MATPADVRALFEMRLVETPDAGDEINFSDLDRVRDENYLKRVLAHCENDANHAVKILWKMFAWRKNVGARDINENNIRMDYVTEGMLFPRGRDLDGCRLLIIKSKMHIKGLKNEDDLKKIIIYWLDRVEREERGKKISLFIDMCGTGLHNMDMELIHYIISLFKYCYPDFLNHIIIFNTPWMLAAAFKIMKSLLPAKAVEKMRFVTKYTLKEVVAPEQTLTCYGGSDDYVFAFTPEKIINLEHTPKRVTFPEHEPSCSYSVRESLHFTPDDTIVFKYQNDEIYGEFTLTNMDKSALAYKVRTKSPQKFAVRPASGTLAPGRSQTVSINVNPGFNSITEDRFLVLSMPIPKATLSSKTIADFWENATESQFHLHRLICHLPEREVQTDENIDIIEQKPDKISIMLINLQKNYENLCKDILTLKILHLVTLIMTSVVVLFSILAYRNISANRPKENI